MVGLAIGVLVLALGTWFFFIPAMRDMSDLRDGERAVATLQQDPVDCWDDCRVTFEAGNETVEAQLPAGSLIKRWHRGDTLPVIFDPEHPSRISLEEDVGWAAIGFASIIPLMGLLLTIVTLLTWRGAKHP